MLASAAQRTSDRKGPASSRGPGLFANRCMVSAKDYWTTVRRVVFFSPSDRTCTK